MLTPDTISAARAVSTETLTPRQHRANRNFRMACSYWVAPVLKMPGETIGEFHCFPEYLNAGLVHGDPSCTCFIPQPLALKYRGKPYKPDSLEVRAGKQTIIELKPRGEFDASKTAALTAFLAMHQIAFEVRANEDVLSREWEAINWHAIIQQLTLYRHLDTDEAERQLIERWPQGDHMTLADIVDAGDREGSTYQEAALYRLAYKGWCYPEFTQAPLDYSTRFFPCPSGVTV